MAFPAFADWTPPWGSDDTAFDAEKAKKRVYDLLKDKSSQAERIASLTTEKEALEAEVTTFKEKDMSALEKANAEIERLKNAKPEDKSKAGASGDDTSLETARLRIALNKGLTEAQVKRLVGSTPDELEADAVAYMEEHGITAPGEGEGGKGENGGKEGQAPPSQRAKVRTGTKQGQQEIDPYEGLTPDELYDKVYVGT